MGRFSPFLRTQPARERGSAAIGVLVPLIAILSFTSDAKARDMTGAWVSDAAACKQIFESRSGKLSFAKDADVYGSGFIYEKGRLIGKNATCTITRLREDGDVLNLITSCSNDVALATMQFSLRIEDDNRIVRFFSGIPELDTHYYRCSPSQ